MVSSNFVCNYDNALMSTLTHWSTNNSPSTYAVESGSSLRELSLFIGR